MSADNSAENDDAQQGAPGDAPPPRHRITAAEARQKAEFILSRAYGLLRDPKSEWAQIRDEETNILAILLGYVAPLAALTHICGLIGNALFGRRYGDVVLRVGVDDVVGTLVSFVLVVVLVFLLGIIINALAENFDGDRSELQSQKVAAYMMTPTFIAGISSIWPPLYWFGFVGVAGSVFLLYRGLPILMKSPEDRAMAYAGSVAGAGIVACVVLFSVAGAFGFF